MEVSKKITLVIIMVLCLVFALSVVIDCSAAVSTGRQKRTITIGTTATKNEYEVNNTYSTKYNDSWIYNKYYNTVNTGNVDHWSNVTNNIGNEVHRVISGSARAQTQNGGNWWDNDWNHIYDANGNLLAIHNLSAHKVGMNKDQKKELKDAGIFQTKKEIHDLMASKLADGDQAWLASLTKKAINFDEKTIYYFDLTTQTWVKGPNIGNVSSKDMNTNSADAQKWAAAATDLPWNDHTEVVRQYDQVTGSWTEVTGTSTASATTTVETGRTEENNTTYDTQVRKENSIVDTEMLDPYTEIVYTCETTVNTFVTNNNHVTTINRQNTVNTTETTYTTTHTNKQHVTETKTVDYQLQYYVFDNSPLIFDLDKNGKLDTAKNEWRPHAPKFYVQFAKFFDITGDGVEDFTEWTSASPSDGLLVVPQNGKVHNALQLFGTAGGYIDGYEKLSLHFDTDGNGWVEGNELEGLAIWIDANNDAVCQDNELKTLEDFDIKRINVKHNDYVSKYETGDGQQYTMWDWWPAAAETRKVMR